MTNFNVLQLEKLDRNLLKAQTATVLRDLIISGQVSPGTKITERDVANLLGISRMPARDALLELEGQGLIVTRPGGRYVIELSPKDVANFYQIRKSLERLALEAAIMNMSPKACATLRTKFDQLRRAVETKDVKEFARADLEIHEYIWHLSSNPMLIRMLHSIVGPIFMMISNQTDIVESYPETLRIHADLIQAICENDKERAFTVLDEHMENSLSLSMQLLR